MEHFRHIIIIIALGPIIVDFCIYVHLILFL